MKQGRIRLTLAMGIGLICPFFLVSEAIPTAVIGVCMLACVAVLLESIHREWMKQGDIKDRDWWM